jgi:hypothetical protein
MNIETIKRRISRLLAVVNHQNTSSQEREAAQLRIDFMVHEHNLSEADIKISNLEIIAHREEVGIQALWPRGLASMLSEIYDVESLCEVPKDNESATAGIIFTGYKADVAKITVEWKLIYPQMLDMATKLRERSKTQIEPIIININGFMIQTANYAQQQPVEMTFEQEDSWGYGVLVALANKLRAREIQQNPPQAKASPNRPTPSDVPPTPNALVVNDEMDKSDSIKKYIKENIDIHTPEQKAKPRDIDQQYANFGYHDGFNIRIFTLAELTAEQSDAKC